MNENSKNQQGDNTRDKLVVDINNNLNTRLADLMSKLLNSTQDKLFNMSGEADNNEDQRRYFELMNQIRVLKTSIADSFNEHIQNFLLPADEFAALHSKKLDEDDGELSLIAQDDMESIVIVKGIGERANAKYREQLSHLEARFEHLALQTPKLFKKTALSPTNFCQAFNDALADNFDAINKKLLFRMFDVEVANKLDALYDSINNRLIDAGILPQIKLNMHGKQPDSRRSTDKPKPAQSKEATSAEPQEESAGTGDGFGDNGRAGGHQMPPGGSATGGNAGQNSATGGHSGGGYSGHSGAGGGQGGGGNPGSSGGGMAPGGGSNIGGFAMTAAPGGTYNRAGHGTQPPYAEGGNTGDGGNGSDGNQGNQGGGGQSGAQGNTGEHQTDNQNSPAGGAEYQHYTAGMPASRVGRVLGNYISGAPFTPSTADKSSTHHAEFFPESTNQHFGHQEIIQALSELQHQPKFEHPDQMRFDGDAIKQAVLAEIAKKSGGAVTKRINQIAEKTIDFIELIFDAIIDDDDISDAIKTLLLRLQIPIIKASMSDQEFFIYDTHAARVLLDTIAEIGVGVTDHADDVYRQCDKVVSTILGEYELTTETFQNALDMLNSYIEAQEAITRAKEQEEQQQVLRKHARATVLKALRATTTGKTLPEAVHPLILRRWPTLMFNHYLANGKENNAWVNIVLTLRHIVDCVQPLVSAEHLAKIKSEKEALFEQTETYLSASINSKKDIQSIMTDFRNTIQEHIDDANYSAEDVAAAEELVSQAEPVAEPPIEDETVERPAIPANVMPGMWFQVYMGEDNIPRRCKLSVIIIEDANLMFVNHKGELVVEKSFDAFNQELTNKTSKMIMGHSAFDHAFKSVIDRLN